MARAASRPPGSRPARNGEPTRRRFGRDARSIIVIMDRRMRTGAIATCSIESVACPSPAFFGIAPREQAAETGSPAAGRGASLTCAEPFSYMRRAASLREAASASFWPQRDVSRRRRRSVRRSGAMTKIHAGAATAMRRRPACEGCDNLAMTALPARSARLAAEKLGEKNLSTQQDRAQAPSRLSRPHGDCRRPQRHRGPPRPRPQAPVGLSRGRSTKRTGG